MGFLPLLRHRSFTVTLRCPSEARASKGDGPVSRPPSFEAREGAGTSG